MQVGDLVYMPHFGEYGIIVSKYVYDDGGYEPDWNVVQFCGYCSQEYEEDLEAVCK
jgi:hypothetical protein